MFMGERNLGVFTLPRLVARVPDAWRDPRRSILLTWIMPLTVQQKTRVPQHGSATNSRSQHQRSSTTTTDKTAVGAATRKPAPTAAGARKGAAAAARRPTPPLAVGAGTVWASGVRAAAGYEVVCGNCFELLAEVTSCSVAAVIIDPPYGITRGSQGGAGTGGWNRNWDVRWTDDEWRTLREQLWRVVAPGGHVLIFSQGEFTEVVRRQMTTDGVKWQALVWIHGDLSSNTYNQDFLAATTHEDITVFYRSEGIRKLTLYQSRQRQIGTHLIFPKPPQPRATMKPVGLMEELMRRYSRKGDAILDCCMASGVCGIAALASGRRFLGVEARLSTFEKAVQHLKAGPEGYLEGEEGEADNGGPSSSRQFDDSWIQDERHAKWLGERCPPTTDPQGRNRFCKGRSAAKRRLNGSLPSDSTEARNQRRRMQQEREGSRQA